MSQKFCANCGNALGENEKFCAKCGTPAPADAVPETAAPVAEPESAPAPVVENEPAPVVENANDSAFTAPVPPPVTDQAVPASPAAAAGSAFAKHKGAIIGIAAAAVVLIAVIVVIMCLPSYQKIDAKDLFYIQFKGVNGNGTAVGYLNAEEVAVQADYKRYTKLQKAEEDEEELEDDDGYSKYFTSDKKELLKAYDKAKNKDAANDMKKALLKIKKEEYLLKIKFDKESGLSNGDSVKCTVEYDEDYLKENKIELTNTEFEIEVEGLVEGKKIDLFDGFNVKFEGRDGEGKATYDSKNKDLPFVDYDAPYSYNLKNGDSYEVTASIRTYSLEDVNYLDPDDKSKGFYFTYKDTMYVAEKESETKSFTVSGLTELKEVDVFKDIKFNTRGAAPYLTISSVDESDCDEIVADNVYYNIVVDNNGSLKVGDKFKVKASTYGLKNEGYKPAGEVDEDGYAVKEFTIDSSFGFYITDKSTTGDVNNMEETFKSYLEKVENQNKDRSSFGSVQFDGKATEFKFEPAGAYVILSEGFADGSLSSSDVKNILFRLYKVTATVDKDGATSTKEFFMTFRFKNAYINAKGEGVVDGYASYSASETEDGLKAFFEEDAETGAAVKIAEGPASSGSNNSKPDDSSEEDSSSDESSENSDDSSEDESSEDESSEEE